MQSVVIVEDEDMIRRGLEETIDWESMNAKVAGSAKDGIEGLALIKEVQPDIVLTDIKMPRMDGISMAERLHESGVKTAIIFLTSYNDFEYARSALRLGAVDYILKPVDEDELREIIGKIAGKTMPKDDCRQINVQCHISWEKYLSDDRLNPYVRRCVERIRQDYSGRLSIEMLAEEYGVSASYLSRKFKDATDMTFGEALAKERITHALGDLKEGVLRVYEIAERNGFGDYKNFSFVFKKYMLVTPTEFLKSR